MLVSVGRFSVMPSNLSEVRLPLLHVDDSDNDRRLVQEAISLTNTQFIVFGADGMESAMAFFNNHPQHPYPALVLLDYDLGTHTGANFLYWLRTIKKQASIPVAMFSGSVGNAHVAECYALGASYFISKPTELARFKIIVRALEESLLCEQSEPILQLLEYQPEKPAATSYAAS